MHLVDWLIVAGFLATLAVVARGTTRYAKSVAGFLAADRCAGRYLISVADGRAAIGLISLVWYFQQYYDSGFTNIWWGFFEGPVMILVAITGWVVYRFRETRALTMAQFLEVRYSRRFRIFCGMLAFGSGILNYGIFPAVSARFLMHFCGLPPEFHLAGIGFDTYVVTVVCLLSTALFFVFAGGQVAVMVTDFLQGVFGNLVFFGACGYLLWKFPWSDMSAAMATVGEGKSLVNPAPSRQVAEENFNWVYWIISAFVILYTMKAWQGDQGYNAAALDAHEARMANVLNGWRYRVFVLIMFLSPLAIRTWMTQPAYVAERAAVVARMEPLEREAARTHAEVVRIEAEGKANPSLADQAAWTAAVEAAREQAVRAEATLSESRTPIVLAGMFPPVLMGLLAAAFLGCYLGTDDAYLHSWGSILVQDVVMPIRKRFTDAPVPADRHIRWLKYAIFAVALWGLGFSLLFRTPNQRIAMYCGITASMFVAGAGVVIIGGLYWRRGTAAAAWTAMIAGMLLSLYSVVIKEFPALLRWTLDTPLAPVGRIGFWLDAHANGQVLSFWTMMSAIALYVAVSLWQSARGAEPFDLDRMLHRGRWRVEGSAEADERPRGFWEKLGFDREFTGADKWVTWITLSWPIAWTAVFLAATPLVVWGTVSDESWTAFWHFYTWLIFAIGTGVTLWFAIGGTRDLRVMFRLLRERGMDARDDGTVDDARGTGGAGGMRRG
jgi:SSS family solute:Na+ symporter